MKLLKNTILAAVAALGLALNASALTLMVNDAYYVGSIENGNPPGGGTPSNEYTWLQQLITILPGTQNVASLNPTGELLDRSSNFASLPSFTGESKTEPAKGTYTVLNNSLYLLGKYGNDQSTAFQQVSHVWFLGAIPVGTSVTLPGAGLSHDTIFTGTRRDSDLPNPSVPEGGVSVMLLGGALLGLVAVRRFIRR